jgi:hypothetical protein
VPTAPCGIALINREVQRSRDSHSRQLVKALDKADLRVLLRAVRRLPAPGWMIWRDWHTPLASAILRGSRAVRDSLDHAPAVYMPNRVHRVRIALKKLRYTLELAVAAAMPLDARTLPNLRKTQDLLGRIHDLDFARRLVCQVDPPHDTIAAETRVIDAVMTAECSSLFTKYVSGRERLRTICDECARVAASEAGRARTRMAARALPVAGLAILPVAVWRFGASAERITS